jgi:hypothetical protein
MATTSKTLFMAVLASAAGCLLTASSVLAQPARGMGMGMSTGNRPTPLLNGFNAQAQGLGFGFGLSPGAFMTSFNTPSAAFTGNPYGNGFGLPTVGPASSYGTTNSPAYGNTNSSPYGFSYSPYTNYYADPLGEALRGTAAVINAEGMYLTQVQDAKIRYEQWQQGRLDTRRKSIEQYLYERAITPTGQDLRERMGRYELRIAMHNPPVKEVLSSESLNTIYKDLKIKLAHGATGQPIPLDPALLKQINLTTNSGGNLGVLKNLKEGGSLRWPLALQGEAYQDEVRRLNQRAAEAVKLAEFKGQVDAGTLRDMMEDVRKLRVKIRANINDLTPGQHIEASRFLNQMDSALKALQQTDVGDYLGQKYMAQGKTVGDLVDFMMRKGLSFAPAVNGDEGAYQALHNYLVGFAGSLQGGELAKTRASAP